MQKKVPPNNIAWDDYLKNDFLRTDRIGEVITFIRYGTPPISGKSKWWHTLGIGLKSYPELKGVSVFETCEKGAIIPIPELYINCDLLERQKFKGKGEIVGWGTDKEPLIKVLEIEEFTDWTILYAQ